MLKKGDTIKCRDADDAANTADELTKSGIEWDIIYERGGKKGIWIEILESTYPEE